MNVPVQYVDASYVDASGIPMGSCPACVDMETGVISINRDVWDRFDRFEKNFILFHEIGHYDLDTDSEYEADEYALRHVYKSAPRSLKRALQTLYKIRDSSISNTRGLHGVKDSVKDMVEAFILVSTLKCRDISR